MLSESSSSFFSTASMIASAALRSASERFMVSMAFPSRSNTLTAYQRRSPSSTLPLRISSIPVSAFSTSPSNTGGRLTVFFALAASAAIFAASRLFSFFRAEISTALQFSSEASFLISILSPFFLTRSIMLTARTTGMPSSMSWVERYRFLSMFVPSTMLRIASGFSLTR